MPPDRTHCCSLPNAARAAEPSSALAEGGFPLRYVSVHVDAECQATTARYGLEQLLQFAGLPYRFEQRGTPAVYYGKADRIGRHAAVWITPDSASGRGDRPPKIATLRGVPVPFERTPPLVLWQGNQLTFDIGRAAAFWLTLESERYALRRDAHDRVPSDASLLAAGWWLDRPPVHAYARLLAEGLDERGKRWDRMPLWPNGKRYAVALTHDVDAPERRTRCRSAIAELLFGGPRPRRHAYWELREEIHARGFGDALLRPMSRRPEWNFSAICEMEQQYGFRSAFYFAVVSRSIGHPCDVDYDASRRRYRRLCRRLRDGGWEVGLHASYLTHQGVLPAEGQHRRLEALAEAGPAGVRHHYLHLGPGDPLPAMTAHAAAGALYDSTMGFNDAPGFRLGAALPVELYDPQRAASSGLIELPMSLADMHLPQRDASAAIGAAIEHLKTVRDLGGLGVLNWHVGVWHDCPAWKESYAAACEFLSEDAEAWIATPREIAAWWKERASRLNPLSATQPHLSAKVAAPPRC